MIVIDYKWFFGVKYSLRKSGYYITGGNKALHREVYKYFNGTIPKGYIIHHKDEDKINNSPSNLISINRKDHAKIHANNRSNETRLKISKVHLGYKYSEEARYNMSIAHIGLNATKNTKEKMSISQSKPVMCIETGIKYKSALIAAKSIGLKSSSSIII